MIRRFECYRPNPPEGYREAGVANPPEEVQFEGVQFSDGTVVLRWSTAFRSVSVWTDMATMLAVHGHPEYGTEIRWLDPPRPCSVCGSAEHTDFLHSDPVTGLIGGPLPECPSHPGQTGDH